MSNPNLPVTSAALFPLTGGANVWIQTLSKPWRDEALSCAARYAAEQCVSMRIGQYHSAIMAEIRSMSPEMQAALIAGSEQYTYVKTAHELHPFPNEPELEEKDPGVFTDELEKYKQDCEIIRRARENEVEKLYTQEVIRALEMPQKARMKSAFDAQYRQAFEAAFNSRLKWEYLYRAVRSPDAHETRYFRSVEHLIDEEGLHEELTESYESLQIKPEMVPTSPD